METYDTLIKKSLEKDFSPSRISTYLGCPKKYEFQYVQKFRTTQNGAAFMGNMIHVVIQEALMNFKEELPTDFVNQMLSSFQEKFNNPTNEVDWKDKTPEELEKKGVDLLIAYAPYFANLSKSLRTIDFEIEKNINIGIISDQLVPYRTPGSLSIWGKLDIALPDRVIDIKTKPASMKQEDVNFDLQFGTYALGYGIDTTTEVEIHALIKTKDPKVQILRALYTPEKKKAIAQWLYGIWANIINHETTNSFIPNFNNFCQNYCDFKDMCIYKLKETPAERLF